LSVSRDFPRRAVHVHRHFARSGADAVFAAEVSGHRPVVGSIEAFVASSPSSPQVKF
jgi:hypothetical protein